MRLILPFVALLGLCLAFGYALAAVNDVRDDRVLTLLQLADQGGAHENEGAREARGYGGYGGGGYCCGGGYGGYGRGGYGRGGYGGYGGYGRGGYGGYGRGGYGRGGYGKWGR